jgi:hypothetical protein
MEAKQEECDLKTSDAVRLIAQTKSMVLKISKDTAQTLDMLKAQDAPTDAHQGAMTGGNPNSMVAMRGGSKNPVPALATGVPYNGPTGGFGTLNRMSPGDMTYSGQGVSNTMPLQLGNSPYNPNQSMTGMNMATNTMSGMGGQAGFPSPMGNQPNMQSMQMQGMSGMGMGAGQDISIDKANRVATQMAKMHELMLEQRQCLEQRDNWLETRIKQLDTRCQKVEVLSDRLYTLLLSFESHDLGSVPREVTKALKMHIEKMEDVVSPGASQPSSPVKALRDASASSDAPVPPDSTTGVLPGDLSNISGVGTASGHHPHMGNHSVAMLDIYAKQISQHMQVLTTHAEATPEISSMLWRMDLALRQLTGTASNLPVQLAVVPEAPESPGRSRAKSSKNQNARSSVSNSNFSSRLQSKSGGGV